MENVTMTKEQFEVLKKMEADYTIILEKQGKEKNDAIYKAELKNIVSELVREMHPEKQVKFGVPKNDDPEKNTYEWCKTFGEFLQRVKSGDMRLKTAMSTTSGQGGYTIPEEWSRQILNSLNNESDLLPLCTNFPMGVSVVHQTSLLTDLTVQWATEAGTKTPTKPTFGSGDLSYKFIYAIMSATKEMSGETFLDLENFLLGLVAENIALELEQEILEGSTFTGLSTASGVVSTAMIGANLDYADLTGIVNRTSVLRKYRKAGTWALTGNALNLVMLLQDANKRPLWNLNNPLEGKPSTILARPYVESDQIADTITSSGSSTIYYGDFKYAWITGSKKRPNMNVLYSETAVINTSTSVTENAFTENKDMWRFEIEKGIYIAVPAAFQKLTGVK